MNFRLLFIVCAAAFVALPVKAQPFWTPLEEEYRFISSAGYIVDTPNRVPAVEQSEFTPEKKYLVDTPQKCAEEPQWNEFNHARVYFSWATKLHPDGYGARLAGLERKEGRVKATLPSLHALFIGPASLFGACGWWPKGLTLPLTIENQVVMASAQGWKVDMSLLAWGPKFSYRLNFDPALLGASKDSEMAVALEHSHWSGGSGDLVNDKTFRLKNYIKEHEIDDSGVHQVNVVSVNFAHKFNPTSFSTVDYLVGKYVWQVSFSDFLSDFGGILTPKKDKESYLYSGFLEGEWALHLTPLFDAVGRVKTEFSSRAHPYMLGAGAHFFLSSSHNYGLAVRRSEYRGMPDSSINMTRWGVWTPAKENAAELFVALAF